MKRKLLLSLLLLVLLAATCVFAACDDVDGVNGGIGGVGGVGGTGETGINGGNSATGEAGENGKDHECSFGEWQTQTAAKCTENGTMYRVCTVCKAQETKTIPATGHTEGSWVIDTAAKCAKAGSKHTECTVCHQKVQTAEIPAVGHQYGNWIEETPATCHETGELGHYHCSACEKNFDIDKNELTGLTISATGDHTYGTKTLTFPYGVSVATLVSTCTSCNTPKQEPYTGYYMEDTSAGTHVYHYVDGHYVSVDGGEITITNDAYCANGTYYVIEEMIMKSQYIRIDDKIYYYGDNGVKDNTPLSDQKVTVKAGNDDLTYYVVNNTIQKDLYVVIEGYVYYFNSDGYMLKNDNIRNSQIFGDNVEHEFDGDGKLTGPCFMWIGEAPYDIDDSGIATEHNNHTDSNSDHACDLCGATSKCAKDDENAVWNKGVDATCTEPGKVGHYHCDICGKNFDMDKNEITGSLVINALGHKLGSWVDEESATCTKTGTKGHYQCTGCNKNFESDGKTEIEALTIDRLSHTYGAGNWTAEVPASCTDTGTKGYYTCTVCGGKLDQDGNEITNLDSLVISAKGHSYGDWIEQVKVSCITDGTCGHYHCTACGKNFDIDKNEIDSIKISASHNYVNGECTKCHETKPSDGLDFSLSEDKGYYIVSIGACKDENIIIPAKYNGLPVKRIGNANSHSACTSLTVTIPDSIESIDNNAFEGCKSLTSIVIPDSVTSLGIRVFRDCTSLEIVEIGAKVTSIGEYAFYGCTALKSVTLGTGVTSIGKYAFEDCTSLAGITLLNGVTSIGSYAFHGCTSLAGITLPDGVTSIGSSVFKDCTALESIAIPASVTSIGTSAFYGCTGLKTVTIGTGVLLGSGITSIGENAFYGCTRLNALTLGDGVISIGEHAFDGCKALTSVKIPNSVPSIAASAFYGCSSLKTVTIGNGVASIGNSAFSGCTSLENVKFGTGATSIGSSVFKDCKALESIEIPDSVKSIGGGVFSGCKNLKTVTIGKGVESLGNTLFYECASLESITLPFVGLDATATEATYTTLFGQIFSATNSYSGATTVIQYYQSNGNACKFYIPSSLRSVTITGGSLFYGAFYGCTMLTSVTLGDGVTSIGENAFYGCKGLTTITIGTGITSIGKNAFNGCTSLTGVYITDIASWCKIQFSTTSTGNPLCYAHDLYLNGNLVTDLVIPDSGVTSIGKYAFYGCTGLESVTLGTGVTSIGSSAFAGCTNIVCVTLGTGVTSIGSSAFNGCPKLIEVYNLSSLEIIAGYESYGYAGRYAKNVYTATAGETKLRTDSNGYIFYEDGDTCYLVGYTGSDTALTLPANCNGKNYEIYQYAFYGRTSLTSVTISSGVTSIGSSAFNGCTSLTSVTLGNDVKSIGDSAFYGCTSLASIALGTAVESIDQYAFQGCTSLASITIPSSVENIGKQAFYNCTSLKTINYTGTEAEWNNVKKGTNWDYYFYGSAKELNYTLTYNYTGA